MPLNPNNRERELRMPWFTQAASEVCTTPCIRRFILCIGRRTSGWARFRPTALTPLSRASPDLMPLTPVTHP